MLTGDLVRVRIQKKELTPSFLKRERYRESAEHLLRLYREGVGRTREQLTAEVNELVGDRTDHKVTRGLAKLIEQKATWASESPVPPAELRSQLWTLTALNPGREAASQAYEQVATGLDLSPDEVRRLLFADRKEEQELREIALDDVDVLLDRYDVALVQAVLLKASELTVTLVSPSPERLRQFFTGVRFHQLMYRARSVDDGVEVVLDGPATLLKQNSRYGMALASWFPKLLLNPSWRMQATVLWTKRRLRKNLSLDSDRGLTGTARDVGAYKTQPEQWFEERWAKLDTDWTLAREGVVLDLGGEGVVCPVYTLRKGERTAYLDIVGFWRKEWLKRHTRRIRKHGPGNLVLAVSARLAGDKSSLDGLPVIAFKEILNAKKVLEEVERVATRRGS